MSKTIFIPKEVTPDETRVAGTPETVKRMVKNGFTVLVEAGAGEGSSITDESYKEAGATIEADPAKGFAAADVVLKLHPPRQSEKLGKHEADAMKEGAILVSFLWALIDKDNVKKAAERQLTTFAMDQIPRITRAQSMDALSSQANLAGYKAVLLGASHLPKIFPMLTTAAGTIKPAKVVIMGAGVAGLQAIATAKRLGAVVEVSDVRPETKEQVQSLGGKFIEVEGAARGEGGYAREQSAEFLEKQKAIVRKHIVAADVVITTALIPGRPAPRLVTADMVQEMRPGSVIVDLAAEQGGNCELTEKNQVVVKHHVTIVGHTNLPGTVPFHASMVYAKNVLNIIDHLFPKGQLNLTFDDDINAGEPNAEGVRPGGSIVTHKGKIVSKRVADTLGETYTDPKTLAAEAPAAEAAASATANAAGDGENNG